MWVTCDTPPQPQRKAAVAGAQAAARKGPALGCEASRAEPTPPPPPPRRSARTAPASRASCCAPRATATRRRARRGASLRGVPPTPAAALHPNTSCAAAFALMVPTSVPLPLLSAFRTHKHAATWPRPTLTASSAPACTRASSSQCSRPARGFNHWSLCFCGNWVCVAGARLYNCFMSSSTRPTRGASCTIPPRAGP